MITSLYRFIQQLDSFGVSSLHKYDTLSRDKKKELDGLFYSYLWIQSDIKDEVKTMTTIAVNQKFSIGIKQSLLYTDKIIVLTDGTRSDLHGAKEFSSGSLRTFFDHLDLFKSDVMHLVPISHFHLGEDEYDDSNTAIDPLEWASIHFTRDLLEQIRPKRFTGDNPIPISALLNLNINFPLVGDISNAELLALVRNEEIYSNYRTELKRLHSLSQNSSSMTTFIDEVREINERVVELNSQVNDLRREIRLSLIEGTVGTAATACCLFMPVDIASLMKDIAGTTTLINVFSSVREHYVRHIKIKQSPYYFAWRMLR